ncbi:GLUG motif-containing protein [Nanoarchaeota archaeon]
MNKKFVILMVSLLVVYLFAVSASAQDGDTMLIDFVVDLWNEFKPMITGATVAEGSFQPMIVMEEEVEEEVEVLDEVQQMPSVQNNVPNVMIQGSGDISLIWNETFGGDTIEVPYGIAVDSNDNIFVTGYMEFGSNQFLIVKYDSTGDYQWNKTIGGSGDEKAYGIAVDSNDDVIIAGYTDSFGAGSYDFWTVKYNSSGDYQWNRTIGGSNDDFAYGVAIDSNDDLFVVGKTISFGTSGSHDFWAVKYNSTGDYQWNGTMGGNEDDIAYGVAIDSNDDIILVGDTLSFGAVGNDFWTVKYNSTGNYQWNKTIGGSIDDFAYGVAVDSNDDVIVAGYTDSFGAGSNDFWTVKYNSTGDYQWNRTIGGGSDENAYGVAINSADNIFLIGYTDSFGVGGSEGLWTVKYNSAGDYQWNKTYGGEEGEAGLGIAIDSNSRLLLTGYTATFSAGISDFWTLKIREPCSGIECLGGSGTSGDPYLLTNCTDLQLMENGLTLSYQLTQNISCSDTINWNSGAGFEPIGNDTNSFNGTFDGQSYTISNLYINRSTTDYVGLFGMINSTGSPEIKNIGLENASVVGNNTVGILVGYTDSGTNITNSYTTGSVIGSNYVGGLVGRNNEGNITNSYATGAVSGTSGYVGGLIGYNSGNITNSYATGDVNLTCVGECSYVGGLVGRHVLQVIQNSYATGTVTATGGEISHVGGLVGYIGSSALVEDSYAIGNVSGYAQVGGLFGENYGNITNTYSIGNVTGSNNNVGGLGGRNYGNITNSYATGSATGTLRVGGLVGNNLANITNSYWNNHTGNSGTCVGLDSGTTYCTTIDNNEAYFYDVSNPPLVNWSYPPWSEINNGADYPVLRWQGVFRDSTSVLNCMTLITENTVYTMAQDVNSPGTCFTISANNVTLDCAGYTINFSQSGSGEGITNTGGYNGTTIKNCNIVQGSEQTGNPITFSSSSYNLSIINNNISKIDSGRGGIELEDQINVNITGNTIYTNGSAIILQNSNGSIISDNNLTVYGIEEAGYGVYFNGGSNNLISDNILSLNPLDQGAGIYLDPSSNTLVEGNTILLSYISIISYRGLGINISDNNIVNATGSSISVWHGENINVLSNTLSGRINVNGVSNNITISGHSGAVDIRVGAGNVSITDNTLTHVNLTPVYLAGGEVQVYDNTLTVTQGNGLSVLGIEAGSHSIFDNVISIDSNIGIGVGIIGGSSSVSNNTITINGVNTLGAYVIGVYLGTGVSGNLITNNTITTTGVDGIGIAAIESSYNNFTENTVSTSGGAGAIIGGSHGINLLLASNERVMNNNITVGNGAAAIAVYSTNYSLVENNTFIVRGTDAQGIYVGGTTGGYYENVPAIGNNFTDNTVEVYSTGSYGLLLSSVRAFDQYWSATGGNATNNLFTNNLLGLYGGSGTFIYSNNESLNNTLSNNSVATQYGNARPYGIIDIPANQSVTTTNLELSYDKFFINDEELPFLDVSAVIEFYNVNLAHTSNHSEQTIWMDVNDTGEYAVCPSLVCKALSTNGTDFRFNVTHFTAFSTSSPAWPVATSSGGGGGGAEVGGGPLPKCIPEWDCTDWSECIDGTKTRECNDLNECDKEPIEEQSCEMPKPTPTSPPKKDLTVLWITIISLSVAALIGGSSFGVILAKKSLLSGQLITVIDRAKAALKKGDKETAKKDYQILKEYFAKHSDKIPKKDLRELHKEGMKIYNGLSD